jgi:hypothetical protein
MPVFACTNRNEDRANYSEPMIFKKLIQVALDVPPSAEKKLKAMRQSWGYRDPFSAWNNHII